MTGVKVPLLIHHQSLRTELFYRSTQLQLIAPFFSNKHTRHVVALALTCVIALVVGYLTLTPQPTLNIAGSDKLHHLIGFAALSLPAAILYRHALYWLSPLIMAFGGGIELIQPFVNRNGELADFLADVVGTFLGVGLGLIIRHHLHSISATNGKDC